jgi:transketolase
MTAGNGRDGRSLKELEEISIELSKQIIEITTIAGSGHPSSSLSMIDFLVALYLGGILRYDPKRPHWPDRDRFILSKGHGVPGLYVILAKAGFFNPEILPTLRKINSPLEGHPNMRVLPGIEASSGSLGQGLSIGLGHALAARLDGRDYRVYIAIGDGEADEGQIWEACMAAAKYKASNLTVILDNNQFQQTDAVKNVMPSILPFSEKWKAFGWHVIEIDGHSMEQVLSAFKEAQKVMDRPQVIVAHTMKGKGLSPFEKDTVNRKHGEPLDKEEEKVALAELDQRMAQIVGGN